MSIVLSLFLIGISLSMDTFSLAINLGTYNPPFKENILYSLIVGLFHFILPLIGTLLGSYLINIIAIKINTLLFFVFLFIGIEMFLSLISKEEKDLKFTSINKFIYAFSVSLDSLTIGLILKSMGNIWFLGPFIFSFLAAIFTYLGLIIGKYSYQKLGFKARILGFLIILFLTALQLLK